MIPYDVDPSLHPAEPVPQRLDDGYSPPAVYAATHPVEPEPLPPTGDPGVPNPTHLPVEPEFGPQMPPSEPEDPGVRTPPI